MRKSPFALVLALIFGVTACAQSKRPMTFEDMMQMKRLGETAVSPDGKWLAYSVTTVNLDQNSKTPELWIQAIAGPNPESKVPQKLAVGKPGDAGSQFAPDGKRILFLSGREGGQQVWLADFDPATGATSNAKKLTSIATEADNAKWSPDSKSIVFTSAVYPDCGAITESDFATGNKCNADRDAALAASKVKAQIFTHLLYRHWNHFTGDKRSHLFLVSVDSEAMRDLTPNDPRDVPPEYPTEPLGCGCAISPDSKELAFTENLDREVAISTNADIFTLDLTNPGAKPVKVSTSPGGDFSPAYSPDSKYLAWRSQVRAGYESDKFRLVVYDRSAKTIRDLLPKLDGWVDEFAWTPDSQDIFFTSGIHGEEWVYLIDLESREPGLWGPEAEFSDLHILARSPRPGGASVTVIATRMKVDRPAEVGSIEVGFPPGEPGGGTGMVQVPFAFERRPPRPARPPQDGVLLVHRRRRSQGRRLLDPSPQLRPSQEISSQIPDPRWPARRVGRLLVLPLERRALRRQRLRRCHDQSARLHGLRPGLRRRRQRRLGRQALHRFDDRARLRRTALPVH
jgi:Tol biopolymer transport system component